MAIKVHGFHLSPFVRIALLAAYEKDVECELLPGDQHAPEYLAKYNPFGKHPALEIDGFILYESRAIARYIATKYESQGTNLIGSVPEEKALIDQWVEVGGHTLQPPLMQVNAETFFGPKFFNKKTDMAVVEEKCAKLQKILDIYDAHLAKSKYLAGDFYSMADLVHLPFLHIFMTVSGKASLLTSRKHVNDWYEDISSRPAWKKILEKHSEL